MNGRDKYAETQWAATHFMPHRARYAKRRDVQPMPWQAKAVAWAYAAFMVYCIFK
jgi:hypothetical protein